MQRIRTSDVTQEMFHGQNVMNHGSQDPASGMRHLAQISTAFDEHEVVRRLSEMVTCTADDAYKPESIDDLDIDFEQFGDFRTMAIAQVRAQRARERKDVTLELERRRVQQVIADNRHHKVTPELLSRHFLVTTKKAKQMQLVTKQVGLRRGVGPMDRRLRDMGPSPNVPRVQGHWYGDVLFSDVTSITQNICMMFFPMLKDTRKPMVCQRNQRRTWLKHTINFGMMLEFPYGSLRTWHLSLWEGTHLFFGQLKLIV